MEKRRFAKSSLEVARHNLDALFAAYSEATGIGVAYVSEFVADDRAFVYRYNRKPINFTSYDRVVGRFSELWPKGTDWPADVPRSAPEALPKKALDLLNARKARQAAKAAAKVPALPGDADWPDDIPQPPNPNNTEARSG